jgi:hypothetical protein
VQRRTDDVPGGVPLTIALRAAEQAGARHAGLDAGDAGRELYLSLGFEAATPVRRFRPSA